MKKTASFDVDCQKTFTPLCPDELPVPDGDKIVAELNRQAALCDFRLGSKDAHSAKAHWLADKDNPPLSDMAGAHADRRWPEHAIVGTEGFELLDGLPHPAEYDYFVWKGVELDMHPYGACYHDLNETRSSGVIEFLRCHGVERVVVGGLALDYCVLATVKQLLKAGFQVVVNLAATRGLEEASSQKALIEIRDLGGILAQDLADYKEHLM